MQYLHVHPNYVTAALFVGAGLALMLACKLAKATGEIQAGEPDSWRKRTTRRKDIPWKLPLLMKTLSLAAMVCFLWAGYVAVFT